MAVDAEEIERAWKTLLETLPELQETGQWVVANSGGAYLLGAEVVGLSGFSRDDWRDDEVSIVELRTADGRLFILSANEMGSINVSLLREDEL